MKLGQGIAYVRRRANIKQGVLAAKVGISSSYLSSVENGRRDNPSHELIEKVALACGVPAIVVYIAAVEQNEIAGSKMLVDVKKESTINTFIN